MGLYSGVGLLTEDFWKRYPAVTSVPLATAWVEHLAATYRADRTIQAYASELERFIMFCTAVGVDPRFVDIDVIDRYFLEMQRVVPSNIVRIDSGRPHARSTMVLRATVVRLWFDYLVVRGIRPSGPFPEGQARGRYRGRGQFYKTRTYLRRKPKAIWIPTEPEWWGLWSHLVMYGTERDRFMLRLSYECGLRVSELVALDVADFDWKRMELHVREGKGGVERRVPFTESLESAFASYIAWRRDIRTGPGPMFVSSANRNYGERIKSGTWNERLTGVREELGMPSLVTHTMRHLVCTDLARQGMDISYIQRFAGHRSIETTQLYIELSNRDLKKALKSSMHDLRAWRVAQMAKVKAS